MQARPNRTCKEQRVRYYMKHIKYERRYISIYFAEKIVQFLKIKIEELQL